MKKLLIFGFLITFFFTSMSSAGRFTKSKRTFYYSFNSTFYKVEKKNEHQPFIKTLLVEYRCSPIEEWRRYYFKYGLCDILESSLETKNESFLIKVYQEADQNDYAKRCVPSSLSTLKVAAKDLCSESKKKK